MIPTSNLTKPGSKALESYVQTLTRRGHKIIEIPSSPPPSPLPEVKEQKTSEIVQNVILTDGTTATTTTTTPDESELELIPYVPPSPVESPFANALTQAITTTAEVSAAAAGMPELPAIILQNQETIAQLQQQVNLLLQQQTLDREYMEQVANRDFKRLVIMCGAGILGLVLLPPILHALPQPPPQIVLPPMPQLAHIPLPPPPAEAGNVFNFDFSLIKLVLWPMGPKT